MEERGCNGSHRYFIAETGAVEETGTIFVISICTACGDAKKSEFKVSEKPSTISFSGKTEQEK